MRFWIYKLWDFDLILTGVSSILTGVSSILTGVSSI